MRLWIFILSLGCVLGSACSGVEKEGVLQVPGELFSGVVQELSIEDCAQLALEANYDIAISHWGVTNADAQVMAERGAFEPSLTGNGGRSSDSYSNESWEVDSAELSLNTRYLTGTEIDLYATYSGSSGDDEIGTGSVGVRLTQPLLRGFGIKTTKAPLTIARRNADISRKDFLLQMINTVTEVENTYWQLVLARERLAVQQASLDSAKQLERLTIQRVEARIMSESDTIEALAAVYDREANVVSQGEAVRRLEDALKEQLSLFDNPEYWTASIVPVTKPIVIDRDVEFLSALRTSLEHRYDYRNALLQLKNLDLSLYVAKNSLLPKLDAVLSGDRQHEASGVGNTFDGLSNSDNEDWSAFVQLEVPLGNKSARARRDQAVAEKERQLLRVRKLEIQIIREVRRAIDALNTSRQMVEATTKAVEFEQKKLENEEIKLDLGESTTDNVVRFIQSLNLARLNYVQSVVDYNLALVRLAQVQGLTLEKYGMDVAL